MKIIHFIVFEEIKQNDTFVNIRFIERRSFKKRLKKKGEILFCHSLHATSKYKFMRQCNAIFTTLCTKTNANL